MVQDVAARRIERKRANPEKLPPARGQVLDHHRVLGDRAKREHQDSRAGRGGQEMGPAYFRQRSSRRRHRFLRRDEHRRDASASGDFIESRRGVEDDQAAIGAPDPAEVIRAGKLANADGRAAPNRDFLEILTHPKADKITARRPERRAGSFGAACRPRATWAAKSRLRRDPAGRR